MRAKFGVYIPVYGGWIREAPVEEEIAMENARRAALAAESSGIHSLWVPDHLLNPIKGQDVPALEAWTTLSALAAVTERIELFHSCLCQGFRHPSVLAKMCATMQELSKGRFRLNLGAGWFQREFEAYGLPWEDHDSRIDRSREQVEIIKGLWEQPTVNYSGRYYSIRDGVLQPKPSPRIPLWWAGNSEKSRELVADHFDGWLMNSSTGKEAAEKIRDMNERLEKRGRNGMVYAVPGQLLVAKTDQDAEDRLKRLLPANEQARERIRQTGYVGSPETVCSKILDKEEAGVDYIIFQCAPTVSALRALKEEVLPLI